MGTASASGTSASYARRLRCTWPTRRFCQLDLEDKVPHHSTFSLNRLGRFHESEILRHVFERGVTACVAGDDFCKKSDTYRPSKCQLPGGALHLAITRRAETATWKIYPDPQQNSAGKILL